MIEIRKSHERGHADHGWLDSRHTFSFAEYYDPRFMGFGPLRVINEDHVRGGAGFGTHAHREMEIVSYVVSGRMAHEDSMGNGSVLKPGDVQRMTAGTGVRHSEMNASSDQPVHFLQIWIQPDREGLAPGYEEKHFSPAEKQGRLIPIVSGRGEGGALKIHQDVDLHAARLSPGDEVIHRPGDGRKVWVQLIEGRVEVNGEALEAGDAAAIAGEPRVAVQALAESEFLLFDVA